MSKKILLFISVVLIVIGGFLIYWYPVQKSMSEKAVVKYMKEQGISEQNIKSKHVMKDYKQGGYFINIELKDDPGINYEYIWSKSRGVVLIVFRGNAGMDEGMKYPPLE